MDNNRFSSSGIFEHDTKIRQPLIVSLLSGKGGVGKSVIALNLGMVAASAGYRTLVVDTDWNFGNIHILANTVPRATFDDIASGSGLFTDCRLTYAENLDLLASPSSITVNSTVSDENRYSCLNRLKTICSEYDFIFVDTPSSDIKTINAVGEISDINLIIINPELTSIADGYGVFKYLAGNNRTGIDYLFINRVSSRDESEFIYSKFTLLARKFLNKVPLSGGYLLDDKEIIDSVGRQMPLNEGKGDQNSVRLLGKLFKILTKEITPPRVYHKADDPSGINNRKELADIRK
jgi:flagellar biosynthesis protein FlhG